LEVIEGNFGFQILDFGLKGPMPLDFGYWIERATTPWFAF
jgi:hypothetical protein